MKQPPNIAIIGATGAVGRELLTLLNQHRFPHGEIRLLASARSAGVKLDYNDRSQTVEPLGADSFRGIDLAFFSAGRDVSNQFAQVAIEQGCSVIDNSSAFRMNPDVPLIIPEVNGHTLDRLHTSHQPLLIANPNCSTIIMLLTLTPIHRRYNIRRVVVSTYQAVSGAGTGAMRELEKQSRAVLDGHTPNPEVFTEPCAFNVFSHDSPIDQDGSNDEERKMMEETWKIWDDDSIGITVTCIRVPVFRTHCESINVTTERPIVTDDVRSMLGDFPGVVVLDDREQNRFPTPCAATGEDDVFVGRIRADYSQMDDGGSECYGLSLFVCGDQLRKGAALNAVQIAERLSR